MNELIRYPHMLWMSSVFAQLKGHAVGEMNTGLFSCASEGRWTADCDLEHPALRDSLHGNSWVHVNHVSIGSNRPKRCTLHYLLVCFPYSIIKLALIRNVCRNVEFCVWMCCRGDDDSWFQRRVYVTVNHYLLFIFIYYIFNINLKSLWLIYLFLFIFTVHSL